jgi:hypothetical protein
MDPVSPPIANNSNDKTLLQNNSQLSPSNIEKKDSNLTKIIIVMVLIVLCVLGGLGYLIMNRTQKTMTNLKSIQSTAKDAQVKNDIVQIEQVLKSYKADKGAYPATLETLTGGDKIYIYRLPTSPYSDYKYDYTTDGNTYKLSTKLGDGSDYIVSK